MNELEWNKKIMKNWKDLFDWMETTFYAVVKKSTFHVRLQVIGEKKPSYSITADGISYFPVTRKMAKKLLRNGMGVEVFCG
jgi:hypothetical protein